MGFLDKIRDRAQKAVDDHGDQIAKGLEKAGGLADKKTKGKYSDRIGKGVSKAKDTLEKLDRKNDDIPDGRGRRPGPPSTPPPSTPPSTPPPSGPPPSTPPSGGPPPSSGPRA